MCPKPRNCPTQAVPKSGCLIDIAFFLPWHQQFDAGTYLALLSLVIDALRHRAPQWVLAQPASAVIDAALCGPVESTASWLLQGNPKSEG